MGKAMNGPDMTVVTEYLRGLEIGTGGTVGVLIMTGGGGLGMYLLVEVALTLPHLESAGTCLVISEGSPFPTNEHATFESLLMKLCHRIDSEYMRRFQQHALPIE
jgi:hypothetical protein